VNNARHAKENMPPEGSAPEPSPVSRELRTAWVQSRTVGEVLELVKDLTGLRMRVLTATAPDLGRSPFVSPCPAAAALGKTPGIDRHRCQACLQARWGPHIPTATRPLQVFLGACGRMNCWVRAYIRRKALVWLVIQCDPASRQDAEHGAGCSNDGASDTGGISRHKRHPPTTKWSQGLETFLGASWGTHAEPLFATACALLALSGHIVELAARTDVAEDQCRTLSQERLTFEAEAKRLKRLLAHCLPEFDEGPSRPAAVSQRRRLVQRVQDFVREHFHRPIGLGEAATSVHRTPAYISRIFTQEVGINFHAYLDELRLQHAKNFLEDPSVTIEEAAQASGYASSGSFRQAFKKHTGLSPSEWRGARRVMPNTPPQHT